MSAPKLSKTQQELLDAMKAGAKVSFDIGVGYSHYSRSDTNKKCTAAAKALLENGLVKRVNDGRLHGMHSLRIKQCNQYLNGRRQWKRKIRRWHCQ
jgi:hypothetical protein